VHGTEALCVYCSNPHTFPMEYFAPKMVERACPDFRARLIASRRET
jgi:hypothetical protein